MRQGREISRPRKKKDIKNEEHRNLSKQKISNGYFSLWEFLQLITHTIVSFKVYDTFISSDSEYSENEDDDIDASEKNDSNYRQLTQKRF